MPSRIATLTMNPAVDLCAEAQAVVPMHKIRTYGDHIDPGGGGVNVARVLHVLGADVLALMLAGGVTGRYVEDMLDDLAVPWRTVKITDRSRVALTIYDRAAGQEFRFVPEGPLVHEREWQTMLTVLERVEADWVVASGSLPRGVPDDFYARAAHIAARRGQRFVLDTSGAALRAALGCGIDLVKPSLNELENLVGRKLPDRAAQEAEALSMVITGAARMVVVSLGPDGAILATDGGVVHTPALQIPVRTAVGAGDALLAAMTLRLAQGAQPVQALAWGVAASAASLGMVGTARLRVEDVEAMYQRLRAAGV